MQGHASDPSSEDHKEMRKLALALPPFPPLQRRPSGPTGGLAPPRPRGTAAGTDVKPGDERRRADCFLLLKHCMVGRGGAVAASNRGKKKKLKGEEGGSVEPQTGTSWKGPQ